MRVPEMPDDLARRRDVAEAAARASGAFHIKYLSSVIDFETKADPRDVLTKADLEGQVAAKAVRGMARGQVDRVHLRRVTPGSEVHSNRRCTRDRRVTSGLMVRGREEV